MPGTIRATRVTITLCVFEFLRVTKTRAKTDCRENVDLVTALKQGLSAVFRMLSGGEWGVTPSEDTRCEGWQDGRRPAA